ncbi:MAG TPA: hypothetical protein PKD53_09435 [Chloroflexaceae bacterium]|nr:hypothetical protein [Chloroflexaceae bacterium]
MILDTALRRPFRAGTNLKHNLPGAGWAYLLPSLELEHTVCLGAPSPAGLEMLARLSGRLTVLCADSRRGRALADASARLGLSNVRVAAEHAEAPGGAADLLVVPPGMAPPPDAAAWLRPEGVLYYERLGAARGPAVSAPGRLPRGFGAPLVVRETPLFGEVRSAVPAGDPAVAALLRRRGLEATSLSGAHADQVGELLPLGDGALQRRLRQAARAGARGLFQAPQLAERALVGRGAAARYGVLARAAGGPALEGPPRYLAELAAAAGVSIEGSGWGLAARGEYRSQKVLFFLCDGAGEVRHIVKLTRDPAFNWRLENERRALEALQVVGRADAVARPLFFGQRGGLAVLGETALAGAPLSQRTSATAGCPVARGALDWLVELAAATTAAAEPAEVAGRLEALREQYVAIYRPKQHYADFLAAQVVEIGASPAPLPTVFQCGDVGFWNALVTPEGRVAFTDWEAADLRGMPLWDLFYFMRSFSVVVARARGTRSPLGGVAEQLLGDTPLGALLVETVRRCCDRIGLPRALARPLFFTCWMYWALRESLQREPDKLAGAGYTRLLQLCIDRHDAPTLRALAEGAPATDSSHVYAS